MKRLRTKFIPTPKESWVINKLKREGFSDNWTDYSTDEMLLFKPLRSYSGYHSVYFFISRLRGCRMEYRDFRQPQLHYVYYMAWPNMKNWHEITDFHLFCVRVYDGVIDNRI